jgi:hypothetical protein
MNILFTIHVIKRKDLKKLTLEFNIITQLQDESFILVHQLKTRGGLKIMHEVKDMQYKHLQKTVGCEGVVTLYTALFYIPVKTVMRQLCFSIKQTWRMC